MIDLSCYYCGGLYSVYPCRAEISRFCSNECRYAAGNITVFKHGHAESRRRSREQQSWTMMVQRCNNPRRTDYKYYGGRGITICERWLGEHGFINFLVDMGLRPIGKGLAPPKFC